MQETRNAKSPLVWMDLEMTGLDPDKENIIEIATLITDGDLRVIAEGPALVIHQKPKLLKNMDDWNKKQHEKSGLLEEVRNSKITVKEAEERTLDFLKLYCEPKKSPLCGSSIHHDRRFLILYMPQLHEFLHYRHIDVSTLKSLIERWYPKNKEAPKRKDAHRARGDLVESLDELKFMREHYFK